MTKKEAIEWLNCLKEIHEDDISYVLGTWYKEIKSDHNKVIDMAIKALEKQMPKKAELCYEDLICPVCGSDVEWKRYCEECGQRIDTGDES